MGKGLIAERVQEAARILELDGLLSAARASSPAVSASVAMGRAIVRDPAVFCLMNRYRTSMPSCASRCVLNFSSCIVV